MVEVDNHLNRLSLSPDVNAGLINHLLEVRALLKGIEMGCDTEGVYTWRLVSGDDATRTFEYLDDNDQPVNLTGYTAACLYDVGLVSGSIPGTIEALTGKVTITIPNATTALFKGNGEFRVKLTSGGGQITTLVYGPLMVKL